MNRKLLVPTVALATAALLAGCATGYQYRDGAGDYYYGQPAVEYDGGYYGGYGGYGVPYGGHGGGWGGMLGFGYGSGFGFPYYWGYGDPHGFYGVPYPNNHRHRRHVNPETPSPGRRPDANPVPQPRIGDRAPLPGPRDRTPPLVRDPALPAPRLAGPMPARQWLPPPPERRAVREPWPAPRARATPRTPPPARSNRERDGRRSSLP